MKKSITTAILISLSLSAFAYDWPLSIIKPESIKSFFAQKRGSTISTSLLLEQIPEKGNEENNIPEVKACEKGKVLIVLSDFSDDNDFFPSTLGQAVLISHPDNMISVYGNLEKDIVNSFENADQVTSDTVLGTVGKTGWSDYNNTLELQIIDTKEAIAINPRLLLPRVEKEKSFPPAEIIAENKDGKRFDLNLNRSFLSGNYKFYQKRDENLVPLKVNISVNGELVDEIEFNRINQKNNEIFITGMNKKYSVMNLYPDDKLFLIGEARIAKGKSIITFENINSLGEKRLVNYQVNVY